MNQRKRPDAERRARSVVVLTAILLLALSATQAEELTVAGLLEEGYFHEVALSDPHGAVERYERVLALPGVSRLDAAWARVRKGICLTLQDRWSQAEAEFREVIENFPAEVEPVRIAKRYLSSAARFFPPDTFFFVELVEPERHVEFLKSLIEGTPLENPVDIYLAAAGREDSPIATIPKPLHGQIDSLRAVLNLEFLNELKQIEGMALGFVPGIPDEAGRDEQGVGKERRNEPGMLSVFLPGSSSLSRGVVTMLLTLFMDAPAGNVDGMSIFKLRRPRRNDPPIFIATDSEREAVLFGSPLSLVEEACRRRRPRVGIDSLANQEDFRLAQENRAGSLLFSYLRRETVISALGAQVPAEVRQTLVHVASTFGLNELDAVNFTLSRVENELRLSFASRIGESARATWSRLKTPVFDSAPLGLVPEDPLGFLTLPAANSPERLRTILKWFTLHEDGFLGTVLDRMNLPGKTLQFEDRTARALQNVLKEMRNLVVVLPEIPDRDEPWSAAYLIVEFTDAEKVADDLEIVVEDALSALVRLTFALPVHARFEDGPAAYRRIYPDAEIRQIRLTPSWAAGYARRGRACVVSLRVETLYWVLNGMGRDDSGFPSTEVPVAASKILFLQPRRLVEALGAAAGTGDEIQILLNTPRAVLSTIETAHGLTLELTLPDAATVLRDILMSLPVAEARGK